MWSWDADTINIRYGRPNFMSTYHGVNTHLAYCLNRFFNVKVVVASRSHPGEGPRRAFSVIVQPHRSIVCSSNVDVKQDTGDTCGHTLANGHGRHAAGPGTFRFRPAFVHDYTTWFYGNNDDVRNFGNYFVGWRPMGCEPALGLYAS